MATRLTHTVLTTAFLALLSLTPLTTFGGAVLDECNEQVPYDGPRPDEHVLCVGLGLIDAQLTFIEDKINPKLERLTLVYPNVKQHLIEERDRITNDLPDIKQELEADTLTGKPLRQLVASISTHYRVGLYAAKVNAATMVNTSWRMLNAFSHFADVYEDRLDELEDDGVDVDEARALLGQLRAEITNVREQSGEELDTILALRPDRGNKETRLANQEKRLAVLATLKEIILDTRAIHKDHVKPMRALLNELDDDTPTIRVVSPNGGESYDNSGAKDAGVITNIKWITTGENPTGSVQISLVDTSGRVIKTLFPSTRDMHSATWRYDPSISNGTYKILVSTNDKGPTAQDYSDGYFELTGNDSVAPKITYTTAKAAGSYEADAGGELSIHGAHLATPDSTKVFMGGIEAEVTWTSESRINIRVPSNFEPNQLVDLYIENANGRSNTVQIKILSKLSVPTIRVTYPNGGENRLIGTGKDVDFRIKWNVSDLTGTAYVYLKHSPEGSMCLVGTTELVKGDIPVKINPGFCPNAPIVDGQYEAVVSQGPLTMMSVVDSSDGPFTITNSQ